MFYKSFVFYNLRQLLSITTVKGSRSIHVGMRNLIFISIVLVLLAGCDLNSLKEPIVVAEIEKEFYINLWEKLNPYSNEFELKIETINDKECLNYSIYYALDVDGRQIDVSLDDLSLPSDCISGNGPARSSITIGFLSEPTYDIQIAIQNVVVNKGQLINLSDRFLLSMETEEGIIIPNDELYKVPDHHLWGYVSFEDSHEQAATDFKNELAIHCRNHELAVGYYGHFRLDNEGNLAIFNPQTDKNLMVFAHYFEPENEVLIRQLLSDLNSFSPHINAKIFDYQGDAWE